MEIRIVYLLLFVSCFICSCEHNNNQEPDDCIYMVIDSCDLPEITNGPSGIAYYEYDSVMYYAPCFNPQNSDEFVYIEKRPYSFKSELYKYNMLTHEKCYLADEVDYFPKWSKNGWIIFNRGGQLWKVKSSGDSLALLLPDGMFYGAEVSPIKDEVICRGYDDYYFTIKCDINGNILDSLDNEYFGEGSWSPDGSKISTRRFIGGIYQGSSFGYYDSTLTTFVDVVVNASADPADFIFDTEWFPDSHRIIWYGGSRYNVTNIITGETFLFSEYCESEYNFYPSFSTDAVKIIWEKNKKTILGTCDGYYLKTSIVITDIDGENEQVILE